jgi:hypothetical protein
MNEPRELMLLSKAEKALSQANTLDDVKDLRDQAAAVRAYVHKAKLGQHLVIEAATIRIRAERRLGEMLQATELAIAAPGNQHTQAGATRQMPGGELTLRDLGLTKSESSRSQQIASLPADVFEKYLAQSASSGKEPTSAGLLRLARERCSRSASRPTISADGGPTVNFPTLPAGQKFTTGFVDPPWNSEGTHPEASSDQLTLDEVCRLPAADLFATDAHLHVWTLPRLLLAGLDVLEAWEFRFRSCLVCTAPPVGRSGHWCNDYGLLLLGVRGSLPFVKPNHPGRLEIDSPNPEHRHAALLEMIEQVSPPPYVELLSDCSAGRAAWNCLSTEQDTPSS